MNVVSPTIKYSLSLKNTNKNLTHMDEERYNDTNVYIQKKESILDSLMNTRQDHEGRSYFDINSELDRSESKYVDFATNKIKYTINKRFSELEKLEKDIENIDYSTFKCFKTLPPKYSDENSIRNNIIFNNNNIYIYAENKNGTLNEQACISVTPDNNIIYCSTKGRRYSIGGYAGIEKNINDEYHFFEDNCLSPQESLKTYAFDPNESLEFSSCSAKMNFIKTNDILDDFNKNKLNTENIFNDKMILNSCDSNNLNTTKYISKNSSVQKLFKYYKKYSQNLEHDQRICKPCAHVYNGNTCMNGEECLFCHHPDHVLISAKKWKKLVKNNMEKLNILLHILRNPNDTNANLLNEMLKHNTKNIKKNKKLNNNSNNRNSNNNIKMMSNHNSSDKKNKNNKNRTYYFPHKIEDKALRPSNNIYEVDENAETYKSKLHIRNHNMYMERNINFFPYHVNI